jgi:hypothetical protein
MSVSGQKRRGPLAQAGNECPLCSDAVEKSAFMVVLALSLLLR